MSDNTDIRLPSLLMQAARSAAVADGLIPVPSSDKKGNSPTLPPLNQQKEEAATSAEAVANDNIAAAALTMVANAASSNKNNKSASSAAALARARSALNDAQEAENNASQQQLLRNVAQQQQLQQRNTPQASPHPSPPPNQTDHPAGAVAAALLANSANNSNTSVDVANNAKNTIVNKNNGTEAANTGNKSGQQGSSSSNKKKGPPLRRGKWTAEEEAYANRLILEFKAGLLPLTDGTTLRTFLSKLLNCDPMRISKKFVGSKCIGKQVFRRRTADVNRLTPEQIQQCQQELSELERRFLERVAQTNRVKSSSGSAPSNSASSAGSKSKGEFLSSDNSNSSDAPSPPWLKPPSTFPNPRAAAAAAAALTNGATSGNSSSGASGGAGTNNRAAAAGRALLQGGGTSSLKNNATSERKGSKSNLSHSRSHGSAGLLAMAEMQRRQSQQSLLQNAAAANLAATLSKSASGSGLAALNAAGGAAAAGLSGPAMAQIARNASAARMAGLAASGHSMNNLMLKTGLSRDQLGQLARDRQLASSHSLSNMMERQSSFDALMSLDFQSLQSIDNLANLIQTGGGGLPPSEVPKSGLKNWSMDLTNAAAAQSSSGNISSLANARRLASEGRMDSLIRSLSSGNVGKRAPGASTSAATINASTSTSPGSASTSNASFNNLLQNIQGLGGDQANNGNNSNNGSSSGLNNLLGSGNPYSAMSLANMLRVDSSTGLTALRMQDGLVQRNSSVDDFLSLVASGDIPHQDPHMLNVPLQSVMQHQQSNQTGAQAAATYLAHQQLLAQAANGGNSALTNALAARAALGANSGSSSILNQLTQGSSAATNAFAAAFAQQQQQARAAQMNMNASAFAAARAQIQQKQENSSCLKRKILDASGDSQGSSKR